MKKLVFNLLCLISLAACKKNNESPAEVFANEDPTTYQEIATLNLGGLGSAEITAYDEQTKRLFAVNNGSVNKIDVIDLSNPATPRVIHSIPMAQYGGFVNSVDVSNGRLAAAIENTNKQAPGEVVIFNTATYAVITEVVVGALPDMVTYSPDGNLIITANEGEPNDNYSVDPEGSISIIEVNNNYRVTTLNFAAFTARINTLRSQGFRVFAPHGDMVRDIEPEYVSVSPDSKTAYVTLQENNGIAVVDLATKTILRIMPLGFKNYNFANNAIDASDRDNTVAFTTRPAFGMYQPDAIATMVLNGVPYLFTANEGDGREYAGFNEMRRVSQLTLDPTNFPTAATLRTDAQLGRLNVTNTLGDTDGDGDFDALYSLGARSFSIWNGNSGDLLFDSRNELDTRARQLMIYDDARSDDKGVEPEAITLGKIGTNTFAFIGLERADAFAIYNVTDPLNPVFVRMFGTGDAPEGLLFIDSKRSPIGQSLVIVASENDGNIKIYRANKL